MSDIRTIAEMAAQFVSEWVLVEDPQTNDALEVQSGKVLSHSKDRDEVYREAVRLRPKRFAMIRWKPPTTPGLLVVRSPRPGRWARR